MECQEETGANMAKKVMGRLGDMAGRPVDLVESDSKLCIIFRVPFVPFSNDYNRFSFFSLGKCIAILGSLRWVKKSC